MQIDGKDGYKKQNIQESEKRNAYSTKKLDPENEKNQQGTGVQNGIQIHQNRTFSKTKPSKKNRMMHRKMETVWNMEAQRTEETMRIQNSLSVSIRHVSSAPSLCTLTMIPESPAECGSAGSM